MVVDTLIRSLSSIKNEKGSNTDGEIYFLLAVTFPLSSIKVNALYRDDLLPHQTK